MFKFNFDVDDDTGQNTDVYHTIKPMGPILRRQFQPHSQSFLSQTRGGELSLPRRDLFDARFQLISQNADADDPDALEQPSINARSALHFLDTPSDLVPLVYEGGLKTWECSLDLASYLDGISSRFDVSGKRVLEIGCGTSIPSLYILHRIFSSPPSQNQTHIHLQDYNASVLELVTIPNIILTWYLSEAAATYRKSEEQADSPLELSISESLRDAFHESLMTYGVHLRFFSGSWDTFDLQTSGGSYNLVLTSETIYRTESLPSLAAIMRGAGNAEGSKDVDDYLCLVAAKVLYFGVGGGVAEFLRCVRNLDIGGTIETVWEKTQGVERRQKVWTNPDSNRRPPAVSAMLSGCDNQLHHMPDVRYPIIMVFKIAGWVFSFEQVRAWLEKQGQQHQHLPDEFLATNVNYWFKEINIDYLWAVGTNEGVYSRLSYWLEGAEKIPSRQCSVSTVSGSWMRTVK
ncbi:hypothetical protein BDR07DRAFT_1373011 [Suillus spraguei]|nr:hypothetical protein BDR07DRAFT_1373011 [Suillus spraguei]